MDGDLVYCNDVCVLIEELWVQRTSDQWRLFIDSSKLSLKAVLLCNGNNLPAVPLAHAVHMQETYTSIQGLLETIYYKDHQWYIHADLKVVTLPTGLQ
jgi:hypothetical protein